MTYEEFKNDCLKDSSRIFVRDTVNGKVGSYSLNQLSEEQRDRHIEGWYLDRRTRTKLRT